MCQGNTQGEFSAGKGRGTLQVNPIRETVLGMKCYPKIKERILDSKRDKDFSSVILSGMGGVYMDRFRDFSISLPPLRLKDGTDGLRPIENGSRS